MNVSALTRALIISLALFSFACEPAGPEAPVEEFPPDPNLPAAVVDLPAPPPASAFEIRERNDDGTLRIEGLLGNRDQFLDEYVEVRGVVSEILGNCDPRRARQRGESCPEPHFFIVDSADEDRRLLVVGYPNEFLRRARLQEGGQHLFRGEYKSMHQGFAPSEGGLLVLSEVDDRKVGN